MPRFAGATGCARDGSGEVQKGGHSGDDFRTEVREGLGEDSRLSNGAIECGDGGDARAGVAGALGGGGFRLDEVVESVEAVAQVLEFCGERHGADLFGGLAHLLVEGLFVAVGGFRGGTAGGEAAMVAAKGLAASRETAAVAAVGIEPGAFGNHVRSKGKGPRAADLCFYSKFSVSSYGNWRANCVCVLVRVSGLE